MQNSFSLQATNLNQFSYDIEKWEAMSVDLDNSPFSALANSCEPDIRILRKMQGQISNSTDDLLVLRVLNQNANFTHFAFIRASLSDPSTWGFLYDIDCVSSGGFIALGKPLAVNLITSCIRTALFLHFKLGYSVICSITPSNTKNVITNLKNREVRRSGKSVNSFVLCENQNVYPDSLTGAIEIDPALNDFISLCKDEPDLLVKEIKRAVEASGTSQNQRGIDHEVEQVLYLSDIPASTNGGHLFTNLKKIIHKHVHLSDSDLTLTVLFVLFTYLHKSAKVKPLLYLMSPEPGSGKTTLLSTLMQLMCNPYLTSDITQATLARLSNTYETVVIDEFDQQTISKGLIAVINSGYGSEGAKFTRAGSNNTVITLSTECAKVISGNGYTSPETILARSLIVNMQPPSEIRDFPSIELSKDAFKLLQIECKKWTAEVRHTYTYLQLDQGQKVGKSSRSKDNYETLLKVAACLGEDALNIAIAAFKQHAIDEAPEESINQELIHDVLKVVKSWKDNRISRDQLSDRLISLPNRPWKASANRMDSFSIHVGKVLKMYRVNKKTIRLGMGAGTAKGYDVMQFENLIAKHGSSLRDGDDA